MKPSLLEVEAARALILERASPLATQAMPTRDARGLVLAADVTSRVDSPPFDKAMMDGYAVIAADVDRDRVRLRVVEDLTAGDVPRHRVEPGCASRIMTGAMMPDGADAVVVIERVVALESGSPSYVQLGGGPATSGQHVLRRGSLVSDGACVLPAGRRLSALDVGLLIEIGAATVRVHPQPRACVAVTGSELVAEDKAAGPGQIPNTNGPMLCGLVVEAGGQASDLGIVRDDPADLRQRMAAGLEADVLVTSGGVSTGDHDFVPAVLESLGVQRVLHGVRMKPGKPLWFGVAQRDQRPVLVFGLPGNPVSCAVCFQLFVRPALNALAGRARPGPRIAQHRMAVDFDHRGDRPTYFPARLIEAAGELTVEPLAWRGSADLRTLAQADVLAMFPGGRRRYEAGEVVSVLTLDRP